MNIDAEVRYLRRVVLEALNLRPASLRNCSLDLDIQQDLLESLLLDPLAPSLGAQFGRRLRLLVHPHRDARILFARAARRQGEVVTWEELPSPIGDTTLEFKEWFDWRQPREDWKCEMVLTTALGVPAYPLRVGDNVLVDYSSAAFELDQGDPDTGKLE